MRKILTIVALLALLVIPFMAVAAQGNDNGDGNGEPAPEGNPIACTEGQITITPSEWECTWIDTSYDYEATFNEAETEWQCPDGFSPSRLFPGGDEACVLQIEDRCPDGFTPTRNFPVGDEACVRVVWVDDERVVEYARAILVEYARAIEVEIAPAYFSCDGDPAGQLERDTCYVEQGEWDCGWTEPVCRDPDAVIVGVSLGCSREAGDGIVYQLDFGVTVDPAEGAELLFNGNVYTESTGGHVGFGSYDWSAEAAESFKIVGDDEGTVKLTSDDCNPTEPPPEHPPTGADPNAALAVVTALTGFALAGIGGSILFMKRRASR